jgi:deoxyadenosine/deoxycytidine kinase
MLFQRILGVVHDCAQIQQNDREMPNLGISIAIEGNIGAGKSTFLNSLSKEFVKVGIKHELLYEPVSEWQSFGPTKQNLLQEMYQNPGKYSFHFQLAATITKCEQVTNCKEKVILVERTILAQLNVFLPLLKGNGSITELEYEICSRFMLHLLAIECHSPTLIVYLRTDPKIAKERIIKRGRTEESTISLEYLQRVHQNYEYWLSTSNNVLIIDSNETLNEYQVAKAIIEKLDLLS